jgi:hypothetical protein
LYLKKIPWNFQINNFLVLLTIHIREMNPHREGNLKKLGKFEQLIAPKLDSLKKIFFFQSNFFIYISVPVSGLSIVNSSWTKTIHNRTSNTYLSTSTNFFFSFKIFFQIFFFTSGWILCLPI